jgi:hypothetical protein
MPPEGSPGDTQVLACDKQVSVNAQAQSCKLGTAYVTFNSNDHTAAIGGVEACTLISGSVGSFPQVYQCSVPGMATIDAFCSFSSLDTTAQCDQHYSLDASAGMCVWDGTPAGSSNCPTGYAFNQQSQCCSLQQAEPSSYPVCLVGSTLVEDPAGKYRCVSSGLVPPPAHAQAPINLPGACGDNRPACNPSDQQLMNCRSQKGTWDFKTCTCGL